MKENSIEEDIKILENMNNGYTFKDCDMCNNYNEKTKCCDKHKCMELQAIERVLLDYKRVLKENECLKNHVHYKNCIACGKEFRSKRDDAKYCIKCSKQVANKNYIANLTEEQKLKRREQAKLAMRKLRANRK